MPNLPMLEKNVNHSPHVVLLGAGASLASFKKGDANGLILPLMNNLIEVVGLDKFLDEKKIEHTEKNFETLYNDLVNKGAAKEVIENIEEIIFDYFSMVKIPQKPTIYDYLILSLREKDLIATFNWDPLLLQAYVRNSSVKRLPKLAFLHGNVGIGVCKNDKILGYILNRCSKCRQPFEPAKLLYPIKEKNYNSDPVIKDEWSLLRKYLKYAYMFTIFGYSAPVADIDAKNIMLEVWTNNKSFELAEVEIIDSKSRTEIKRSWKNFIVREHYQIQKDFFKSYLAKYPRRSCDAFAAATLMCKPWNENSFPKFDNIEELHEWLKPLLEEEENFERDKTPFKYKTESD